MERLHAHDTLYLWWLGQPAAPVLIGTLRFVPSLRGVSLHYAPNWLQQGFPLSEDLPLLDQEFLPQNKDVAVGAVDDARPDRWGERVIRFIDRPLRSSLMEFLYLAGDERFGALGVSTSASAYLPRTQGPLPSLSDVGVLHQVVQQVLHGEPISEYLLSPAFDVLPIGQALGYQQMRVGIDGAHSTLDNALSEHAQFGLRLNEAQTLVRDVVSMVARWRAHFAACGVRQRDLDALAEQIDHPELLVQRQTWLRWQPR